MSISSSSKKSLLQLVMEKLKAADIDYTIGLYEDSGRYHEGPYTFRGKQRYGSGKLVCQVGYDNEYGVPDKNIPPRPFLVPGAEQSFDKAARQAILTIANGEGEEIALEKAAQVIKQGIQRYITALQTPPNAPLTIMLKGSSNPLIDTGKMRRSISYKREK